MPESTHSLCTIMIPTFNQASFLKKAIDSALAQDYPDLEIIVGNDCSTDATIELLASYDDPRLKCITHPKNIGRVANYHDILYNKASGKWVLNLDGDDFLLDSHYISAAVRAGESNDAILLVFADRYEMKDPIPEIPYTDNSRNAEVRYFDGLEYLLSWPRKGERIHHLTTLYLREKAIETGFYTENIISSDYESLFRLLPFGLIAYIPVKAAVWRHHESNASVLKSSKSKIEDLLCFESIAEYVSGKAPALRKKMMKWMIKNISNKYYGFLLNSFRNNNFSALHFIDKEIDEKYPALRFRLCINPLTWIKIVYHMIGNKTHK